MCLAAAAASHFFCLHPLPLPPPPHGHCEVMDASDPVVALW